MTQETQNSVDTLNRIIQIQDALAYYRMSKLNNMPEFIKKPVLYLLKKTTRYQDLNNLIKKYNSKKGFEFIEDVFEHLDFSFSTTLKSTGRIPAEGRLLIVANHPLGVFDGLSLLMAIRQVRSDVRIVTNHLFQDIEPLKELIIPEDQGIRGKSLKKNLKRVAQALQNEEAVIIFPSESVSRFGIKGIKDGAWRRGVIYLSRHYSAPVLPAFINARSSKLFYTAALFSRRLSSLLVPREIFRNSGRIIDITIGHQIPAAALSAIKSKNAIQMLRKHTYMIGRFEKGIFSTEKNVIHPVNKFEMRQEIENAQHLGETDDGMKILLMRHEQAPNTMREIARLREITFRKVGEGTGQKADTDKYDFYYHHLVLWDDKELEVVGAYRFGLCDEVVREKGLEGLYTSTLFHLSERFEHYLPYSIELGRSFVQPKYWNSNALDYLWHGIGAFLYHNPHIKYLFGPVSISKSYSKESIDMMVYFYTKWFTDKEELAKHKMQYILTEAKKEEFDKTFTEDTYKKDFKILKSNLKHYGHSVPTLYKQYSELCVEDGVRFSDFGIDADFGHCVDGFLVVEVPKITDKKQSRYIHSKAPVQNEVEK